MRISITALACAASLVLVACGPAETPEAEVAETRETAPIAEVHLEAQPEAETVAAVAAVAAAEDSGAEPAGPAEITPEFAALPAPYNTASYAAGRRTFRLCSSCHVLEEGGGNRVGPNLYGMFGREVGGLESFGYSEALQEADFVWTAEQLDDWLANPRTFLPGNRMSFAGVRKPEDRAAVIAYMMVETGHTPAGAE